jgi:hypothetical protein
MTCRAPNGCPNFVECYEAKECQHAPDDSVAFCPTSIPQPYQEPVEDIGTRILRRMVVRKPAPCGCVGGIVHTCGSVV